MALLWTFCLVLYVTQARGLIDLHIAPELLPLFLLIVNVGIGVMPFNIFYYPTRRWLIGTIRRLVTAPYHAVKFKDFYLGDQFCSLVVVLFDLDFMICFFGVDFWHNCLITLSLWILFWPFSLSLVFDLILSDAFCVMQPTFVSLRPTDSSDRVFPS